MTQRGGSHGHIALGPGGEFDIVRRMLDRWGEAARSIGDDAAILPAAAGGQRVVSTDTSVEDVHFRREWLGHAEIGYRATAAALSDLAAMAAEPEGIFLALTLAEMDVPRVDELADGIGECVRSAGTLILGGDVTRGAKLSLTVTVIGSATVPLLRSGAVAGDRIYVTGRLGGSLRALRELRDRRLPVSVLRDRFAHPVPRLREARWLAERGAHAAIDISDGLIADARHLAVASGVEIHLRAEAVPAFPGATSEDALASGEEYELLVTAPGPLDAAAFRAEFGLDLTEIGEARGDEADVVLTAGGRRVAPPAGYDHFTAR